MPSPTGSVVAISSAASTVFSIGIVFLGYWGVHEGTRWSAVDIFIATIALLGFVCLGLVPWMATSSVEPDTGDARIRVARRLFLAGVSAIWLAVATSIVL
ncbi:hypothetical protein [Paraburkholderia sp. BL10I2N1]|uniref:hypothetical protein n=1 Tax=Paraburkholderia sp. BL10I2N1 TaxID=1938796 RepID=UPI00105CE360|nr:hypothetical protein [Paraburkholderia sp. BL10I2N1]TDN61097.1 hypothetical protein B0G77_4516 [Paraburkholderia sp. BL10I2N1]